MNGNVDFANNIADATHNCHAQKVPETKCVEKLRSSGKGTIGESDETDVACIRTNTYRKRTFEPTYTSNGFSTLANSNG